MGETYYGPKPARDELQDITDFLKRSQTQTAQVQSEIQSMLDELESLSGRKPDQPKAA